MAALPQVLPFSLLETQEKEGFLGKEGSGTFGAKKYQPRWFILRDTELYYFKTKPKKGKAELAGILNLTDSELVEDEQPGVPFSFAINIKYPQPRTYWLKGETKLDKKQWLLALAKKLQKAGSTIAAVPETKHLMMTHDDIITALKKMYFEKMMPLEQRFMFDEFFSPLMRRSDFEAKPMVMLLGQYSVGKTSFIQYLLKRNFPGMRIGPEPTTDRFTAVMYGEEERTIPGNALSVDQEKPFTSVSKFGTGFLSKFEASLVPSEILKNVSFIDTPGVLSGEKQRIGREYDFPEVCKWFAGVSDSILLLFDAHKLDISDEFRDSILALKGNDEKIKIILNKADQVTTQQLVRVYGSLMWSLGKVINTPEVMRVYIGSFWDKPYKNPENEKLFRAEQQDLLDDLNLLPRNATIRKVNELVKRARTLRAHIYIIDHVKKQIPLIGREKKQQQLTQGLQTEYDEIARVNKLPIGDFPNTSYYEKVFPQKDFSKFPSTNEKLNALMDEILMKDLPNFMTMISPEKTQEEVVEENNPFGDGGEEWGIPEGFRFKMKDLWNTLSPSGEPLSGNQLRNVMLDTKAPQEHLKKIWTLSDLSKRAKLDEDEFILAMWLSHEAAGGNPPPQVLPEDLIPPSKRGDKDKIFTLTSGSSVI